MAAWQLGEMIVHERPMVAMVHLWRWIIQSIKRGGANGNGFTQSKA